MMQNQKKITVKIKKSKLSIRFLAAILGLIMGVFGYYHAKTQQDVYLQVCAVIVFLTSIFCIFSIVYFFKKMLRHTPAFIFTSDGIYDNMDSGSSAFVKWDDIESLKILKKPKPGGLIKTKYFKFLLIYIKNPDFYIGQYKGIKKLLMRLEMKKYGTPLYLSSGLIELTEISFDKLVTLITNLLSEHKKANDTQECKKST